MKKLLLPRFLPIALLTLGLAGATSSAHAQALQLITNGSFEADAVGTAVGSPPAIVDSTTYTGYRFYNVSNPTIGFGSQIIANASLGSNAMRLDVNNGSNPPAGAGAYGLDIFNNRITITPNRAYRFTFDAAFIGGGNGLTVIVAEFDAGGNFTGEQTIQNISLINTDTLYHNYTVLFTATVSTAASVNLLFSPAGNTSSANALSLDNIRFGAAVPEPGTVAMFAVAGVAGLCFLRKRHLKASAV